MLFGHFLWKFGTFLTKRLHHHILESVIGTLQFGKRKKNLQLNKGWTKVPYITKCAKICIILVVFDIILSRTFLDFFSNSAKPKYLDSNCCCKLHLCKHKRSNHIEERTKGPGKVKIKENSCQVANLATYWPSGGFLIEHYYPNLSN